MHGSVVTSMADKLINNKYAGHQKPMLTIVVWKMGPRPGQSIFQIALLLMPWFRELPGHQQHGIHYI